MPARLAAALLGAGFRSRPMLLIRADGGEEEEVDLERPDVSRVLTSRGNLARWRGETGVLAGRSAAADQTYSTIVDFAERSIHTGFIS